MGEEPEKPYSGRFVLRISPEGHWTIALAAQLTNKSLNTWAVEHLVESASRELNDRNYSGR
ncbi:MAG: toxin-antitoxin system HicB family antitoxin [bacterium]